MTTVRSRALYLAVAGCLGAVLLWFITLDEWSATRDAGAAADHVSVQGFTLLVLWGMTFFLLVYAANVVSGAAELWKQSQRIGRVARAFGGAMAMVLLSVTFGAFLFNESAARLDATNAVHMWPGGAMIPIVGRPSLVAYADAEPQHAAPVLQAGNVGQPLVLADDRTTVGAFDPSGALSGSAPRVQHWFVLQRDASAMALSLAVSGRDGAIPLVTIEPFGAPGADTPVLEDVAQGTTDAELVALARVVADASPQVVLVRWAHEMDLYGLYPWSSGDPSIYRAAYRHVVSLFREQGATNVQWVWSPSGNSGSGAYYPGDDVVDYVGMTVLGDAQWDQILVDQPARSFRQLMAEKYPEAATFAKPMIVAELGVSGTPEHQQEWLASAASALADFPNIRLVSYFDYVNAPNNHMPSQPDWRISASAFDGFVRALAALPAAPSD